MGHQWPYCQIQIKSARHGSSIVKFKEKKINLQQGLLNFPATHSSSTLQSYLRCATVHIQQEDHNTFESKKYIPGITNPTTTRSV